MFTSVRRVNRMSVYPPVATPLLSNYSNGRENMIYGWNNDSDTEGERRGSSKISEVSVLTLKSVYMFFFSIHIHAKDETDSES